PGAKLVFTWGYTNAGGSNNFNGNSVTIEIRYDGVLYYEAKTPPNNDRANPPTALTVSYLNGASCEGGCGTSLAEGVPRTVALRLPYNIRANGTLELRARAYPRDEDSSRNPGSGFDDPYFETPVSIADTGICLVKNSVGGAGKFDFVTAGDFDTTAGNG